MAWIVLFVFVSAAASQTLQSACFSTSGTIPLEKSTAFSACSSLAYTFTSCNALPTPSLKPCLCKQEVLNDIIDCESEQIECLDSEGTEAKAQYVLSNWHLACDTYITFTPTTPLLSSLMTTIGLIANPVFCSSVITQCQYKSDAVTSCIDQFPSTGQSGQFSSCLCQQPVISAASVCEYDGNSTCFGVPAAYSNIDVWKFCPAQASAYMSVEATMTVESSSLPALSTPGSTSAITSPPSTSMPSRGSTTAAGSAASTTSTAGARQIRPKHAASAVALVQVALGMLCI